jgi:hypothetical protein
MSLLFRISEHTFLREILGMLSTDVQVLVFLPFLFWLLNSYFEFVLFYCFFHSSPSTCRQLHSISHYIALLHIFRKVQISTQNTVQIENSDQRVPERTTGYVVFVISTLGGGGGRFMKKHFKNIRHIQSTVYPLCHTSTVYRFTFIPLLFSVSWLLPAPFG